MTFIPFIYLHPQLHLDVSAYVKPRRKKLFQIWEVLRCIAAIMCGQNQLLKPQTTIVNAKFWVCYILAPISKVVTVLFYA